MVLGATWMYNRGEEESKRISRVAEGFGGEGFGPLQQG